MIETIFLDRDGVINDKQPEDDYVKCVEEFRILPGVPEAICRLSDAGLRLIVITNQRGIARGRMTETDLEAIHRHMISALSPGKIDGVYFCPHDKDECKCRKPEIELFLRAQAEHPGLDFKSSVVVGDSLSDLEAAAAIRCHSILIADVERQQEVLRKAATKSVRVSAIAPSLLNAVPIILDGVFT